MDVRPAPADPDDWVAVGIDAMTADVGIAVVAAAADAELSPASVADAANVIAHAAGLAARCRDGCSTAGQPGACLLGEPV